MKIIAALEPNGGVLLQIIHDDDKVAVVTTINSEAARKVAHELNKLADMSDMLAKKQS